MNLDRDLRNSTSGGWPTFDKVMGRNNRDKYSKNVNLRFTYCVARNFWRSFFLQISDFLCYAGTNFCN